jgi:DNA-binding PadR family transcriptional regulator
MSHRALPELTHLQFIVIGVLLADEQSGKDIRRELKRQGVRRTGPAFYQMMARLEEAGWIDGFYTQEVVDAQIIKERRYRVKPSGVRAWNSTRDFYSAVAAHFDRVAHV